MQAINLTETHKQQTSRQQTDACGRDPADVPRRASARCSSWAVTNAATSRLNYLQQKHQQLSCSDCAGKFPLLIHVGPSQLMFARFDLPFTGTPSYMSC